jgi:hypothetical protein
MKFTNESANISADMSEDMSADMSAEIYAKSEMNRLDILNWGVNKVLDTQQSIHGSKKVYETWVRIEYQSNTYTFKTELLKSRLRAMKNSLDTAKLTTQSNNLVIKFTPKYQQEILLEETESKDYNKIHKTVVTEPITGEITNISQKSAAKYNITVQHNNKKYNFILTPTELNGLSDALQRIKLLNATVKLTTNKESTISSKFHTQNNENIFLLVGYSKPTLYQKLKNYLV